MKLTDGNEWYDAEEDQFGKGEYLDPKIEEARARASMRKQAKKVPLSDELEDLVRKMAIVLVLFIMLALVIGAAGLCWVTFRAFFL